MSRSPLHRVARRWALCALLCLAGNGMAGAEARPAEARHLPDLVSGGGSALFLPGDVAIGADGLAHRVSVFSLR